MGQSGTNLELVLTLGALICSHEIGFNLARTPQAATNVSYRVISKNTKEPAPGQSLLKTRTMELLHSHTFLQCICAIPCFSVGRNYNLIFVIPWTLFAPIILPLCSRYLSLPVEFPEPQWEKSCSTFSVH